VVKLLTLKQFSAQCDYTITAIFFFFVFIDFSNVKKLCVSRHINWVFIESEKKKSLANSACESLFKRSVAYYLIYFLKCLIFRDIIYREMG
jgi:hypothetical protein